MIWDTFDRVAVANSMDWPDGPDRLICSCCSSTAAASSCCCSRNLPSRSCASRSLDTRAWNRSRTIDAPSAPARPNRYTGGSVTENPAGIRPPWAGTDGTGSAWGTVAGGGVPAPALPLAAASSCANCSADRVTPAGVGGADGGGAVIVAVVTPAAAGVGQGPGAWCWPQDVQSMAGLSC